ncbi:MAG: Protein-glutamate methylesterase [Promethearchaeota archaeon]|nr:MAG: Protein-glutamate methylesterase [Candidatus Lokiarchaeota archaeon]
MDRETQNEGEEQTLYSFPIVGIGCSAGCLDVLKTFFKNLSPDPDLSFILVMHLDPTRETELNNILEKFTDLEVKIIQDREKIAKNVIFIRPPNKNVVLKEGRFYLEEYKEPRGQRLPIDFLFGSLADQLEDKSIGIVLSGTGTDGTLGLRKIKGHGGIAIVQDPSEAKYSGMPNSALSHVEVDYVLSVKEMAKEILRYVQNYIKPSPDGRYISLPTKVVDNIDEIIELLRGGDGEKILAYKKTTLSRRISKRMAVKNINNFEKYATFLEEHPSERTKLFEEVLIGVTEFFRDKETFMKLKDEVIPEIIKGQKEGDSIRVWVIGCSTGEEAYSIALLFRDYLTEHKIKKKVVIFASDANRKAIKKARSGEYPENISAHVPEKYIRKYFVQEDSTFKIKQSVRNMIVFAHHNAITDPPFSEMDLISCRNFLIYIKTEIQEKLLKIFHYSLKREGFLFLGTAETVGVNSNLFSEINRKAKIFKKKRFSEDLPGYERPFPPLIDYEMKPLKHQVEGRAKKKRLEEINYGQLMNDILLNEYSPSSVVIDSNNRILYTHGRTGKFLEPSVGKAELDIQRMARQGLDLIITSAIKKARTINKEIKFENVRIETNGDTIGINLIVRPIKETPIDEDLLLVIFQENLVKLSDLTENKIEKQIDNLAKQRIEQLQNELKYTKSHLQSTVEELESTNEELKAANEELQSSNEELKSTNEELQTSKEELQSVNEELMTVNNELETKVEELTDLNNDLNNLIESSEIATIFLGEDLNIKRFTPSAKEIFSLIENDIGRDFRDITSKLRYENLTDDISKVQDDLQSIEKDVKTNSDKWYTMRINPYRTEDNRIKGSVLTFFDITEKKRAEEELKDSEQKYKQAYQQAEFYQDLLTHDFNNLLQVILLQINQLENEDIEKINKNILHIKDQIKRGKNLIGNIQRLAKVDENRSKNSIINLTDFTKEQINEVKRAYNKDNVKINFDYPKDTIEVIASNFLDSAIQNLLNNSILHNERDPKKIYIRIGDYKEDDNDFYKISIEDNGKGIPDNQKKQIREGTIPRKNDTSGSMGIGLSIVNKVIQISKGEMWIENKVEADYSQGTRVVILLPKAKTEKN